MIHRSQEEWRVLFAKHAASGLSEQQFCQQESIGLGYFKLRKKQLQPPDPSSSLVASIPAFVRVQKIPVRKRLAMEQPRVILRHGRSEIDLHSVSPAWLAQLLTALA